MAVDCERAFLTELDGNCKTPIAGQVSFERGGKQMFATNLWRGIQTFSVEKYGEVIFFFYCDDG